MICADCTETTATRPCEQCGADPLLDGRYRLEEVLGRGTSGVSWAATRLQDGAMVAIKAVTLGVQCDPKARELLQREVAVMQQLDHPAIPALLDHFQHRMGGGLRVQYLVQDFISGHTLSEVLASHRFDEREVTTIVKQVAEVLDYLHGCSPPVIHRDIKPSNLMRREDGRIALIDFGSVKDALSDPDLGGSTVAGTFGFMAPEQFRGEATPASDLYGLGATAVALLTRVEPRSLLDVHDRLDWRRAAQVSPAFAALLDGLLANEPERRSAALSAWRAHPERAHEPPQHPDHDGVLPLGGVKRYLLDAPSTPDDSGEISDRLLWVAATAIVALIGAGLFAASALTPHKASAIALQAARCDQPPCAQVRDFSLRGLRLGQTLDEARNAFPELRGVEALPAAPAPTPPWQRYDVRTSLAGALASCTLAFADHNTLSSIDCAVDPLQSHAEHDQVLAKLTRGLRGQNLALPADLTLQDATGGLRVKASYDELSMAGLSPIVQQDLRLEVWSHAHDAASDAFDAELQARARQAQAEARAKRDRAKREELDRLRSQRGSPDGDL